LAFAICVAWSAALFVKTASESRAERLRASFRFAKRSCRLCASGFATSRRRDCGQLPDALRQDRPAPPAQGVEFGFGQSPSVVGVDGAARLAQQRLHQLRRAEFAGFDGVSRLPEKMGPAQDTGAPAASKIGRPAVVDRHTGTAGSDADIADRLSAAPVMRELQGQPFVGDDVNPSIPAGVRRRLLATVGAHREGAGHGQGGRLPVSQRKVGPDRADGPALGEHPLDGQFDREGMQVGAMLQRPGHAVGESS